MRILNVTQSYFPFWEQGGPVAKVRAIATELARCGHQITVLTADLGLGKRTDTLDIAKPSQMGWEGYPDGIHTFYLCTRARYRSLTLNPDVVTFCRYHLRQHEIVHIYGLYDLLGPAVGYFCRRRGVPYVIEPMGMYRPIDRNFRLKKLWHVSFGSALVRNAAQVVATSEMEYDELLTAGIPEEKLVIRYNGVDSDLVRTSLPRGVFRAKWNIAADEPLILFLSRIIPRKGADILIEAFAALGLLSGKLVIAGPEGESGYIAQLRRRARELGYEDRVIFAGPIYNEDKKALFTDADIFVLPSRYENFANAPAEAIACGVPVVITESCGIHTLVNNRAGLVVAREKTAIAGALRRLLNDKGFYARLKDGCAEVTEQLSWPRLTALMESYYNRVLQPHKDKRSERGAA